MATRKGRGDQETEEGPPARPRLHFLACVAVFLLGPATRVCTRRKRCSCFGTDPRGSSGWQRTERLALSYQLEAVHSSAARLAATSWSGSLEVERRTSKPTTAGAGNAEVEGEDEVRIHYWRCVVCLQDNPSWLSSNRDLLFDLAEGFTSLSRLTTCLPFSSNQTTCRHLFFSGYSKLWQSATTNFDTCTFPLDRGTTRSACTTGETSRTGRHRRLFVAADRAGSCHRRRRRRSEERRNLTLERGTSEAGRAAGCAGSSGEERFRSVLRLGRGRWRRRRTRGPDARLPTPSNQDRRTQDAFSDVATIHFEQQFGVDPFRPRVAQPDFAARSGPRRRARAATRDGFACPRRD